MHVPVPHPGEAVVTGLGWVAAASCTSADPELWFPPPGAYATPARLVCRSCVSLYACREYAIARPELSGIWGGMTEKERRETRRERRGSAP